MTPVIGGKIMPSMERKSTKWFKMPIIDSAVPRDEIKTGMKYYGRHTSYATFYGGLDGGAERLAVHFVR